MECLLRILTTILLFISGYTIRVNYLIGVPRLGNTSHWDYYFSCNTEGLTLQWEANGNPLVGFNTGDVGRVSYSSRGNFNYTAAVLTSRPISGGRQAFDSVLMVSVTSPTYLNVACRNGTSSNRTDNTIAGISADSRDFSNSVALQYFMKVGVVSENSTTSIFICGTNNTFLQWMTNSNIYTFTSFEDIGSSKPAVININDTLNELPIFIANEPYQIVSVLFVSGSSDINVRCRNNDDFLDFPPSSEGSTNNTEPVSDARDFTSGRTLTPSVETALDGIDRIDLVLIAPCFIIPVTVISAGIIIIHLILHYTIESDVESEDQRSLYEDIILQQVENDDFRKERLERYNTSFTYDKFREFMDDLEPGELYFEFEFIKAESKEYSQCIAKKNKERNRFQYELPSDDCLVELKQVNDGDSDYINASYIDGYKQERAYIVTQTPMDKTEGHFWKMIYEQRVETIVMFILQLLKEKEFTPFWPGKIYDEKKYDNLTVLCEGCSSESSWNIWKLKLFNYIKPDKIHVTFYEYSEYSHEVPMNATSSIQLIKKVNDDRWKLNVSTPIVLVSTIGTGCTGVFITLDAMMKQMVDEKKTFCIFKFVLNMWGQRKRMVRSLKQYKFIYNTLRELLESDDWNLHEVCHAPQMENNSAAIETDQIEETELKDAHHKDLSLISHAPQMENNSAAIKTDQIEETGLEDVSTTTI